MGNRQGVPKNAADAASAPDTPHQGMMPMEHTARDKLTRGEVWKSTSIWPGKALTTKA
jgi:hypothetical protein